MASVRDSQKDLISVTVSDAPNGAGPSMWPNKLNGQRRLVGGLVVLSLICLGLVVALVVVSSNNTSSEKSSRHFSASSSQTSGEVCMTEGCIGKQKQRKLNNIGQQLLFATLYKNSYYFMT